jgi:hypothetical protein
MDEKVTIDRAELEMLRRQLTLLATKLAAGGDGASRGLDSVIPTPRCAKLGNQQVELLKSLPKYSGRTDKSYSLWKSRIEGFVNTFNLDYAALEPHVSRLLQGRALQEYLQLQKKTRDQKSGRYPAWVVVDKLLSAMDDPVQRSLAVHGQIMDLCNRPMNKDNIEYFRALEYQLDPAPLGDRLFLLFTVFPESRDPIMAAIDDCKSIDDACDIVLSSYR